MSRLHGIGGADTYIPIRSRARWPGYVAYDTSPTSVPPHVPAFLDWVFGTPTEAGPGGVVGLALELLYDISGVVGQTRQMLWDMAGSAGKGLTALWDISGPVGRVLSLIWDVLRLGGGKSVPKGGRRSTGARTS